MENKNKPTKKVEVMQKNKQQDNKYIQGTQPKNENKKIKKAFKAMDSKLIAPPVTVKIVQNVVGPEKKESILDKLIYWFKKIF